MAQRVIIDTDPGIDDALAILLALRSPDLQISAITTVSGNVPVEIAARNVLRIISLVPSAPSIPIAQGASGPLQKKPVYSTGFHGGDGLGGIDSLRDDDGNPRYPLSTMALSSRNAVDEILFQLAINPKPLTIVALGPLTNLAAAIQKDHEPMSVDVETRGDLTEGMTVADRRFIHTSLKKPPNADICLNVDAPGFIAFFLKRLLDP